MPEENEPLHIILEQKEKEEEKKEEKQFLGLTAASLDFFKWVVSTLILGAISQIISCNYNKAKLSIEQLEADSKLITAASGKFDTSLQNRIAYLSYIKPFISTDSIRTRIQQTIEYLSPSIISATNNEISGIVRREQNNIDTILSKKSNISVKNQLNSLAEPKLKTNKQSPISLYKDSVNNVLNELSIKTNLPAIDSVAIQKITETYSFAAPSTINNFVLVGAPVTQWCKEGYYVEYNNTLRIGINDLSVKAQQITVNFKDIEANPDKAPIIKDNVTITVGQTFTLDHPSYCYQITLNYIGAAGKNPFTKAAYITVATYKKL